MATLTRPGPLNEAAVSRRSHDGGPTWHRYLSFLGRHAVLMLACMGAGLICGITWDASRPETFSATASVVLPPVPSYASIEVSGRPPRLVTIDTDAQLLQAPEVRRAVAMAAGLEMNEVDEAITVTATPLSRVLHIAVRATDPRRAAEGALAAAEGLIDVRGDSLASLRDDQTARLQNRILELRRTLYERPVLSVVTQPSDPLVTQVQVLEQRLSSLRRGQQQAAEIIVRPTPPLLPVRRSSEVSWTSGLMLGLLGGIGLSICHDMLAARRDPR